MNTEYSGTPLYGQFRFSRRKSHIFSLKLTHLIRTPVNTDTRILRTPGYDGYPDITDSFVCPHENLIYIFSLKSTHLIGTPVNTNTWKIRTLWHVPFLSVLTGLHCTDYEACMCSSQFHPLVYFVSLTVTTEYNNEAYLLLFVTYLFLGNTDLVLSLRSPKK